MYPGCLNLSLGEGCNMKVATNHNNLFIAGKEDPRCPVGGLESVLKKTTQVYDDMGVPSHFKVTMQFD